MASITDLKNAGTDLVIYANPIYEPLNAPQGLRNRLGRFPESVYNLNNDSRLFKLLVALCGEAGAGSIQKELLYPKLQSRLESTYFSDLDDLFGNTLGIARLSTEIYDYDPKNQTLKHDQWVEVFQKDASYRNRCLIWMRAIIEGPTPHGIALAATAAIGIECTVIEQYKFLENSRSDNPAPLPNLGQTTNPYEFIIIPATSSLTQEEKRSIARLIDLLRPANSFSTIYISTAPRLIQAPLSNHASSYYFTVKRLVTGKSSVNWPATDSSKGLWITTSQEEAPTFSFLETLETATSFTVNNVSASSTHVGDFSATQKAIFSHLNNYWKPNTEFLAKDAIATTSAPIRFDNLWLNR